MSNPELPQPIPEPPVKYGLWNLPQVPLPQHDEAFLQSLRLNCAGSLVWIERKMGMAREFLALTQLTDRLALHWMDIRGECRMLFDLRVTVPCLPDPSGPLVVENSATLGLTYREEFLTQPQPGYAFLSIIRPQHVLLANVAPNFGQPLCLGPKMEPAVKIHHLIVGAYLALTLQSYQFDERDSAGVLSESSARWWQKQTHLIPLSKEPFLNRQPPNQNPNPK